MLWMLLTGCGVNWYGTWDIAAFELDAGDGTTLSHGDMGWITCDDGLECQTLRRYDIDAMTLEVLPIERVGVEYTYMQDEQEFAWGWGEAMQLQLEVESSTQTRIVTSGQAVVLQQSPWSTLDARLELTRVIWLLAGCLDVSQAIFETVDRDQVVPGTIIRDTSPPDDSGADDSGADDSGGDTGPFTGGCLELHGDPDHFAGSDASLPHGATPRTVEFWFKNANNAGTDVVAAWGSSGAGFAVGFYNGFPTAWVGGSPVYSGSAAVSDGSWHHLGVAWDPGTTELSFWFDGVRDSVSSVSGSSSAGGVFWLGDDPHSANSGDNFEGVLDELHVWDKVLGQGEFGQVGWKSAPAGVVAWYHMNYEGEGSGLALPNETGNSALDLVGEGSPAFVVCGY